MKRPQLCPDPARLRRLAEGTLASAEQEELTHHLDACPDCQRGLEEVAAGRPAWARAVRHVDRERLSPDSAFWPAVRQLEHEIDRGDATVAEGEVSEEIELDFLGPPEAEGSIGRLDRFDVVEVIGRGGMGIVLKARDACLERFVAVKLMDPKLADNPTARQRFCREARAAAQGYPRTRRRRPHRRGVRRRRTVPGDALRRWLFSGTVFDAKRQAAGRGGGAHRDAGGLRPGRRPRRGADPSGREAGQHSPRKRSSYGQDHRLRPGAGGGRRATDAKRPGGRDARLHGPGTGPRRGTRRAGRTCSASAACSTRSAPASSRSTATRRFWSSAASPTRRRGPSRNSTRMRRTGWRRSSTG